jgi:TolB-like protein/Tfp pilus assembly protein PilF
MPGRQIVFGPFLLDADAGTLLRKGEPVLIGYRGFLLLSALLDRPGEVVTKSDLIDAAWQGAVVEETNLSVQIAALRKALGPASDGGDWIATIPRVGYRFARAAERAGDKADLPGGAAAISEAAAGPSIAVLPFVNLSDDREQEYFADGMVEEIITALSRMRWLFVIARNSSFAYKGRAVDVKQVGQDLGVRYVLEGSVRKAGNRVRIAGQLVDASTGTHLWADRFDGGIEDIFDLQDQVTSSVVAAIAPKLEQAEIERVKLKPTGSLDAYDYYLRGLAARYQWTRESNEEAFAFANKAIQLDPDFAAAYGLAVQFYSRRKTGGWVVDREREAAEASRLARRAADLGRDDPDALWTAGIGLAFVVGDLDSGSALIERALTLNPNLAAAWFVGGMVKMWAGEPEVAIERLARAMRLSPYDPQLFSMRAGTGGGHFFAGRYAEALSWAEMSAREQPESIHSASVMAASAAMLGRYETARTAMERLRQLLPELRVSSLRTQLYPIQRAQDFDRWAEGLGKAGLPD